MKKLSLCLAIAACGPGPEPIPDAGNPADASVVHDAKHPDASPDALSFPHNQECIMGNLPASRTKTYINGDSVDPAILNEAQDLIISASLSFQPQMVNINAPAGSWGAIALVTDSGGFARPAQTSTGAVQGNMNIPFKAGDRLIGFRVIACGNASADVTFQLSRYLANGSRLDMTGGGGAVDINRGTAWGTLALTFNTTHTMLDTETLFLEATPNAAGYSIATVIPQWDRLLP